MHLGDRGHRGLMSSVINSGRLRRLMTTLAAVVTCLLLPVSAQVSHGEGAAVAAVPFGQAALWASALVPQGCDVQSTDQCNWVGAGDAWRYAFNNLRLALESASEEDRGWLPVDQVAQVHGFVTQMGQDMGMWYGNWPNVAEFARQIFSQLEQWLESSPPSQFSIPRTDIGTFFPAFGRSAAVPADGNMATSVRLANGYSMPVLGFGTWELPPDGTAYQSVRWALEVGYRHIDTAQAYGNEEEVGRAIRDSGIPRAEICIVTKLSDAGEYHVAQQRFDQQLAALGVEYIDVYMLHGRGGEERREAWQQMEQLYDEGKIKALGVSNFDLPLLEELLSYARIRPHYLQNKYSVYQPGGREEALQGESLMEWLVREKVVMTGYSVIHPEHGGYLRPLEDPHVVAIAQKHKRTPSQVLHRWILQLGGIVIPRSTKYERIRENGNLFTFMLTEADMRLLNGIASLYKSAPGTRAPEWCDDVYRLQAVSTS